MPFSRGESCRNLRGRQDEREPRPAVLGVELDPAVHQLRQLTGADLESLCKKAALLAIAEFQSGARVAPLVVLRSDFLAVLDSERGSPKSLTSAPS